ncbi:MAG: DNA primase small subunit domain-containing protein [Candidatus Hodarchaeota archaeon]
MNLKTKIFLKRLFQAYYKKYKNKIPPVSSFNQREFAFIPWDKEIMIRHIGYDFQESLLDYLTKQTPRHVFSSGTLYSQPNFPEMEFKDYLGCDLIIDIDVDHFYTPCKEDHDIWICKDCGKIGKGMPEKCSKCGKLKIRTIPWICNYCLNAAKEEIKKLVNDFLIADFGINTNQIKISFSGHRGYHLKVENDIIRNLSSEERREIVDYITGNNISFEVLGLRERSGSIFGFSKESIGWPQKILSEFTDILSRPNIDIEHFLLENKFNPHQIKSFLNSKELVLNNILSKEGRAWSIEGFNNLEHWNRFLKGLIKNVGVQIDEPVTIDIHRLIRYPGSLHGKTGFRVQELELDQLEKFNPLDEDSESLDPIVFKVDDKITQKLEIIEEEVPITQLKGKRYGPYKKGEIIEVPHHFAVFLLCKEVAIKV